MSRSAAVSPPSADRPPCIGTHGTDFQSMPCQPTDLQQAAVAKLAYGARQPGAVVLLCGPAGVGKTTVLRILVEGGLPPGRTARLVSWADHREHGLSAVNAAGCVPDVLVLDDAHRAAAHELGDVVERHRRESDGTSLVLAGTGRLLSLVAGDARLEQAVRLRVSLPTFTLDDSRRLLAARLPVAVADAAGDAVVRTIHEIAAGVPAVALRLADVAALLAAADPRRGLTPDDVETIHRRLSPAAA